jgi:hypothetical protein
VLRYNGATGAFIDAFVEDGSGRVDGPTGVTFGPDGNLYTTSIFNSQVLRYDGATGAFLDVFVPAGSGGLSGPHGLTFGPDGNLYVADIDTDEVLRYDGATGEFLGVFVTRRVAASWTGPLPRPSAPTATAIPRPSAPTATSTSASTPMRCCVTTAPRRTHSSTSLSRPAAAG